MSPQALQILWFVLLGGLLTGYAILDGFDLGVGILHPLARNDHERRLVVNSIGPLWDGNEVWLVTFGGALFAAFPPAYAAIMSSLYLPVMFLLVSLVGRAISIEFRSKRPEAWWRAWWDWSFFLSSACVCLVFGVAAGNIIAGIPLGEDQDFHGSLLGLFSPYALLVGAFSLATCAMHGAAFLQLRTEGELQARAKIWCVRSFAIFLALFLLVTAATLLRVEHAADNFERWPAAWLIVLALAAAIANIPRSLYRGHALELFVSTSATIAALVFLLGMALFPRLVVSSLGTAYDLTVFDASSSPATLALMRNMAFIGLPLIGLYTFIVYRTFRGPVILDKHSY